jgi:hypothetical protein
MKNKTKNILGWIGMIYAGILLIGELAILFIPSISELAKKTPRQHVMSFSLIIIYGGIGYLLFKRSKINNN